MYAIIMVAVSLTFQVEIAYSSRQNLIRPELREVERRYAAPTNFLIAGVFLLSIPVALVSPLAAILMWPVVFLAGRRVAVRLAELRS
jgi:hypothetical protein